MNQNSPFHDPNQHPLPDANQIQRQTPRSSSPTSLPGQGPSRADRQQLQRLFLILLGVGLVLGLLTALGIGLLMARLDLIGVPTSQPQMPSR